MPVRRIYSIVANEQVTWIAAGGIVAFVADMLPFWYRPFEQEPRQSVGCLQLVFYDYHSITCGKPTSFPFPASVLILFNPFQELRLSGLPVHLFSFSVRMIVVSITTN
jgi:hypothetical protein